MALLKPISLIILSCVLGGCSLNKSNYNSLELQNKTLINSESRFRITPTAWIPGKEIKIELSIESTQNPDLLIANPIDYTLLSDNQNTPFAADSWTITHQDNYIIKGNLVFPLAPSSNQIELTFYTDDPFSLQWDLPTN